MFPASGSDVDAGHVEVESAAGTLRACDKVGPMHRHVVLSLFLFVSAAHAQDVITIGSGTGNPGGSVSIPVYIRDVSATTLGVNNAAGSRIQGLAFKVFFSTDVIDTVTIARAGVTAQSVPMYENNLQGAGWSAFIASFNETTNLLPFVADQAAPGNQVAVLTLTLKPGAAVGTVPLTFDAPGAILSNQAGTARETVANSALALVNGSVSVVAGTPLSTPASLIATATSTSTVNATWAGVGGAHHYEIWRSFNGGAYAMVATPAATSYPDANVPNTAYLYRVRAVDAAGGASSMSNVDLATTVSFTTDTVIRFDHFSQLRTAINAVLATAGLSTLPADATFAKGLVVRAQHALDLRNAITAARQKIGLPSVTFAEVISANTTPIRNSHLDEIRNAVQ
jgi:hypothetical protein